MVTGEEWDDPVPVNLSQCHPYPMGSVLTGWGLSVISHFQTKLWEEISYPLSLCLPVLTGNPCFTVSLLFHDPSPLPLTPVASRPGDQPFTLGVRRDSTPPPTRPPFTPTPTLPFSLRILPEGGSGGPGTCRTVPRHDRTPRLVDKSSKPGRPGTARSTEEGRVTTGIRGTPSGQRE